MSSIIYNQGTAIVNVPASGSVTVWTRDSATIKQLGLYPNVPPTSAILGYALNGVQATFGPFTTATQIEINGGAGETFYSFGISPAISEVRATQIQLTPVAVNVTGAVSAAAIFGGIVTSTTAAAVAGTVPTGAVMEAASNLAVGDSYNWSVIATGANAFTVTAAASGHTLVGSGVVATLTSGYFRTVKTAASTFVTYRLS